MRALWTVEACKVRGKNFYRVEKKKVTNAQCVKELKVKVVDNELHAKYSFLQSINLLHGNFILLF